MTPEELEELVKEKLWLEDNIDSFACERIAKSVMEAYRLATEKEQQPVDEPPPKRQRFCRLPDGNFILPEIVEGVFVVPAEYSYTGVEIKPNRVVILTADRELSVVFSSANQLSPARDKIAAEIEAMMQ